MLPYLRCAALLAALLAATGARAATGAFGARQQVLIRLKDRPIRPTQALSGPKHADPSKKRIAVLFCGSPRSFVFPLIHWSIKVNLIDALQANVDIFVRTSLEDNIHGVGIGESLVGQPM